MTSFAQRAFGATRPVCTFATRRSYIILLRVPSSSSSSPASDGRNVVNTRLLRGNWSAFIGTDAFSAAILSLGSSLSLSASLLSFLTLLELGAKTEISDIPVTTVSPIPDAFAAFPSCSQVSVNWDIRYQPGKAKTSLSKQNKLFFLTPFFPPFIPVWDILHFYIVENDLSELRFDCRTFYQFPQHLIVLQGLVEFFSLVV